MMHYWVGKLIYQSENFPHHSTFQTSTENRTACVLPEAVRKLPLNVLQQRLFLPGGGKMPKDIPPHISPSHGGDF